MKKSKTTIFKDGARVRLHNKRLSLKDFGDRIVIKLDMIDKDAKEPACIHECDKNILRHTIIGISHESMKELSEAYLIYIDKKNKKYEA